MQAGRQQTAIGGTDQGKASSRPGFIDLAGETTSICGSAAAMSNMCNMLAKNICSDNFLIPIMHAYKSCGKCAHAFPTIAARYPRRRRASMDIYPI